MHNTYQYLVYFFCITKHNILGKVYLGLIFFIKIKPLLFRGDTTATIFLLLLKEICVNFLLYSFPTHFLFSQTFFLVTLNQSISSIQFNQILFIHCEYIDFYSDRHTRT